MFVLVGAGGLMATAQLAPIAKDFKIDALPVSLIGITLPALTFALSIDRILNGVTRPFFGWVSDNIGRENTMLIAFGLEAVGIWALSLFGHDPVMFVVAAAMNLIAALAAPLVLRPLRLRHQRALAEEASRGPRIQVA